MAVLGEGQQCGCVATAALCCPLQIEFFKNGESQVRPTAHVCACRECVHCSSYRALHGLIYSQGCTILPSRSTREQL